jgi:O-antigen ligase
VTTELIIRGSNQEMGRRLGQGLDREATQLADELNRPAPYFMNIRQGGLDWGVIAQLCICIIPAMVPIDYGEPRLGAQYLAGSLLVFLTYHFYKRDRFRYLSLLVGAGPALSLMRGVFFYNSFFFFLSGAAILWATTSWQDVAFVCKDPIWKILAILCVIYWAAGVANRGSLAADIRSIEFALACGSICLLSTRRSYLATGLVGIGFSATAYAIAMLPYGDRLGEGVLDNGQNIGNPVILGVPCALVVLLSMTDRGRHLLMEDKPMWRLILCLVVGQWLILSGSRGSWLITLTCLLIVFACSKMSRKTILSVVAVGVVAVMLVLSTGRGQQTSKVFNKTVDSNRTLANRTSGRSTMWLVLPEVFAASPVWGWGPGNAADTDYLFTGRHLMFHSLYEQIIAECGLLGFIPLMLIIFSLMRRAIRHYKRFGEVMPLIGIVGFMLIGVSVTAFDFVSGVYFGLALCSREMFPRFVSRELQVTPMSEAEASAEEAVSVYGL